MVRALSAASLVLLFPVLYFTFGRGGWIALAAGLAVAIAVDPRRLQLVTTILVIAPWPALALWQAYESPSLTTQFSALADASDEGKRLALTIAVLAVIAALVMTGYAVLADRITVGRRVRYAYGALLVLVLVGCRRGRCRGPRRAVGVRSPCARLDQAVLAERQRRPDTAALQPLLERPPRHVGVRPGRRARAPGRRLGAGTFERWWLEHRDVPLKVRDAHGLYVETLAELGPIGLAGLLLIVVLPLVAGVRARRSPLVAPALAGFVALAVHAGIDWDWEMPAVMIAGLTCAGVLLLANGVPGRGWTLGIAIPRLSPSRSSSRSRCSRS